ncbi:MAG: alpha/beta hydrolase [Clostridia bacterium]|nr:alpha/beta hydrolase [Clostridia bacterium]
MCNYKDLKYWVAGSGADIVLLHGWGANKSSYINLISDLSANYRVWALDLWGFGDTPPPSVAVGAVEYAEGVNDFIQNFIGRRVTVVGHSFGGRVAIVLANISKFVDRLILIDSAGVPPRFSFRRFLAIKKFHSLKKKVEQGKCDKSVLESFGSADWKNSKGVMRGVLSRVVNEDLVPIAKKIAQPTLLLWGKYDNITPLYMAKTLRKTIKDSKLIVVSGDHFCLLNSDILSFIYKFLENWE